MFNGGLDKKPNEGLVKLDTEFGTIRISRNTGRFMRLNIRPDGQIILSVPNSTSDRQIRRFIDQSADYLRTNLTKLNALINYNDGDKISRLKTIHFEPSVRFATKVTQSKLIVHTSKTASAQEIQQYTSHAIAKALRIEAEHYLPKRLHYFAIRYGYKYTNVRLSHAKTRWGSCSSNGTISLNIALMKLPDELIDYVLLHELTHTVHMNHSADFWHELASHMPDYQLRRSTLKKYSPYI